MNRSKSELTSRRKRSGSSIVEFGPALGILLICFFFPLLDMLTLGVSYGLCMVLNSNQVHEASLLQRTEAENPVGTVCKGIPDQWLGGMGQFVKATAYPKTELFYRDGTTGPDKVTDRIVMVRTTVICSPFLTIPLPVINVPGLNGPATFQIVAERPMENPDYAPKSP